MLCQACENLWSTIQTSSPGSWNGVRPLLFDCSGSVDSWGGAHHIEPEDFLSAVVQKCYICCAIFRDFSPELCKQAFSFRMFYHIRLFKEDDDVQQSRDYYELEFTIETLQGQAPIAKEQVFECSDTFKILPCKEITVAGKALALTDDILGDKCKEQVRRWLTTCNESHKLCKQDWQTADSFPARLLNIEQEDRVRLKILENNARPQRYVTLSHCWDTEMPLGLTLDTQEVLLNGLPIAKLPSRFRDAVRIARWMGVDYIWIDTLCILQDSKQDWLAQLTRMGDIYTNSYCNIAATSAGHIKGCFPSSYPSMVEAYTIPDPRSSTPAATRVVGYDSSWSNNLLDSPLHNKGWVLQERPLSPRTIHFGQEQIFWECLCEMVCEAYPGGVSNQFRNHKTRVWRQSGRMLDPEQRASRRNASQRRNVWQTAAEYISGLIWPLGPKLAILRPVQLYEIWSRTVGRYIEGTTINHENTVSPQPLLSQIPSNDSVRHTSKKPYRSATSIAWTFDSTNSMKELAGNGPRPCNYPKCDATCIRKDDLHQHCWKCHPSDPCCCCGKVRPWTPPCILSTSRVPTSSLRCDTCGKSFSKHDELNEHLEIKHR